MYRRHVRFRNYSKDHISVPYQVWRHPKNPGQITLSVAVDPGEVTTDFDPEDPLIQLMLKAHPELRPYIVRNAWEKILAGIDL